MSKKPRNPLDGFTNIAKLHLTVSKTADGMHDYLQVVAGDQFTVNVVLIADLIEIKDVRPKSATFEIFQVMENSRGYDQPRGAFATAEAAEAEADRLNKERPSSDGFYVEGLTVTR